MMFVNSISSEVLVRCWFPVQVLTSAEVLIEAELAGKNKKSRKSPRYYVDRNDTTPSFVDAYFALTVRRPNLSGRHNLPGRAT
jgi:hypothetical protein